MRHVVAAVIWDKGKILVCQRRKWDTFGLLWEFPGGKLEANESPANGLMRELREELGIKAQIGAEIYRTRHRYKESNEPLELVFFLAEADASKMRNFAFEKMQWCAPDELSKFEFLPADREIVSRLIAGDFQPPLADS